MQRAVHVQHPEPDGKELRARGGGASRSLHSELCNGRSVCDECGVDSSHPPGTALPPLPHAPGRCDNRKGRSQSGFGLSLSQAGMVGLPKRLQFCCRVQNKRRSPRPAERQCVRTCLCVLSRLIKPRPQLTLADSCLLESLVSKMEDSTQKYFEKQIESKETLVKSITENLIGIDALIDGPFESHKQVYADYAASGKAVKFIEDYIRNEVLPVYSNTHTSSSFVGIQTSCFREEARGIIRDTVRRWTPALPLVPLHGKRCHSLCRKRMHRSDQHVCAHSRTGAQGHSVRHLKAGSSVIRLSRSCCSVRSPAVRYASTTPATCVCTSARTRTATRVRGRRTSPRRRVAR